MVADSKLCNNKKLFIEKYPEWGSVGATLKAIGVKSRTTFYNWCDADPHFKEIYEIELVPNRRDEVSSLVYRAATGRLGTTEEQVFSKYGGTINKNVPVSLSQTQMTAAFAFLKATDHVEKTEDPGRLVFCEKNQVELSTQPGKPLDIKPFVFILPDGTKLTAKEIADGRSG